MPLLPTRRAMVTRAMHVATIAAMAVACQTKPEDVANGDDPIAALEVSTRSTRYDGSSMTGCK